jgi:hypothetical protein
MPFDHLLLNTSCNIGPLISRWKLDKFKNCWSKCFRTSNILTLLYQQFSNVLSSQRDMNGPRLGALSNIRWSGVTVPANVPAVYVLTFKRGAKFNIMYHSLCIAYLDWSTTTVKEAWALRSMISVHVRLQLWISSYIILHVVTPTGLMPWGLLVIALCKYGVCMWDYENRVSAFNLLFLQRGCVLPFHSFFVCICTHDTALDWGSWVWRSSGDFRTHIFVFVLNLCCILDIHFSPLNST